MKRNILFALTALAVSGVAQAQDGDRSTQLRGIVQSVCSFSGISALTSFGNSLDAGDTAVIDFTVQCNDIDGAVISMTSTEGGLESDDVETLADFDFIGPGGVDGPEIDYTAEMTFDTIGTTLTLDTTASLASGLLTNDVSVDASAPLFNGDTGQILVTLLDTANIAGGYSDTLQIGILAN